MLGLVLGLCLAFVVPVRGYLDQRADLRARQVELARQIEVRDGLVARLRALRTNPEVLETEARRLGLSRPGERSWQLPLPARAAPDDRGAAD